MQGVSIQWNMENQMIAVKIFQQQLVSFSWRHFINGYLYVDVFAKVLR